MADPKGEWKDCRPFIELPSSEFDQGGLISRQIPIPGGDIFTQVFNFHRDGAWRLSIMEAGTVDRIDIRVTTRTAMADELIMFSCAPNSGVQYWGQGSAVVEIKCANNTNISAQLTPAGNSQYQLTFDENDVAIAAASPYASAGSNNGHPQPYMNYFSIYSSGNYDLRLINTAGNTIYEELNVVPQSELYNKFKMNNTDRLQVKDHGAAILLRVSWFNHL